MALRAVPWLFLFAMYAAAYVALGDDARELAYAACAVAACALAAALAREWVPDPWATRAALVAGLTPAGFELSSSPDAPVAALLAAGLLLALRARDHPTRLRSLGGAACLALVPWFGLAYALPAGLVLLALVYWTYRRGRRLYAFLALEFAGASVVTLGGVQLTDSAAGTGIFEIAVHAPVVLLALASVGLIVRSRREKLSRAIPAWRDAEVGVGLTALAVAALVAAAALEPVGAEAGVPVAGALAALAMRSFRRAGVAVVVVSLALTVYVVVALATGARDGWI